MSNSGRVPTSAERTARLNRVIDAATMPKGSLCPWCGGMVSHSYWCFAFALMEQLATATQEVTDLKQENKKLKNVLFKFLDTPVVSAEELVELIQGLAGVKEELDA